MDIGANNLVACSTSGGSQYLFKRRPLFDQYRAPTEHIAALAGKLPEARRSSRRIKLPDLLPAMCGMVDDDGLVVYDEERVTSRRQTYARQLEIPARD